MSTEQSSPSDLIIGLSNADLNTCHSMHSSIPFALTARTSLTYISNKVNISPATVSACVHSACVDDLTSLSHSHPTIHFGCVAMGSHDTNAWTQERKLHDTGLDAAAALPSLGSSCAGPDNCSPVDGAENSFAIMGFGTQKLWTVEYNVARLRDDHALWHRDQTFFAASGSGTSLMRVNATVGSCSLEKLSEGRRRVGEILVRCGVIGASDSTPIEFTATGSGDICDALVGVPETSSLAAKPFPETDGYFTSALTDWASEWVHTLVIQPYLQGGFRFQYCGNSTQASTSVALRIRRVLSHVNNPVQVAIHALWFINILTENGTHSSAPFLSVPMFRYLRNNGVFIAEDFMFRAFVACAMISDKTVNDATLSTTSWNRLTCIPQVTLNATERYALSCLKWNVVMTQNQWQETIIYFRSCIKVGSTFDPFAYDKTCPSGIMARYLDHLIDASYVDVHYTAQHGTAHLTQAFQHLSPCEVFDTAEWCPEDDPVINHKPRTVGIAPGADQALCTSRVGMTAKDLLDSILGSSLSSLPDLAHLARPGSLGTTFCGSFRAPFFS